MEMILDRELQRKMLSDLAEVYPGDLYLLTIPFYSQLNENDEQKLVANLTYLDSHGLIESGLKRSIDNYYSLAGTIITHKGMDFLANDGGLSSILNVVTVRFDAETLRAIFEQKINDSDLSPADKKKWTDELRGLPAESIKHLTTKALDAGFDSLPLLFQLIQSSL